MTRLDKPLRREIAIDSRTYTLTLGPEVLKLVPKGHRRGVEIAWGSLLQLGTAEVPPVTAGLPAPLRMQHG